MASSSSRWPVFTTAEGGDAQQHAVVDSHVDKASLTGRHVQHWLSCRPTRVTGAEGAGTWIVPRSKPLGWVNVYCRMDSALLAKA